MRKLILAALSLVAASAACGQFTIPGVTGANARASNPAIVFDSQCIGQNGVTASATVSCSSALTVTAGDTISCYSSIANSQYTNFVSDPVNGYYGIALNQLPIAAAPYSSGTWSVLSNAAAGTYTPEAFFSSSESNAGLHCFAFKNALGVAVVDAKAGTFQLKNATSGANPNSGTATLPSTNGEVILGAVTMNANTPTAGSGFTLGTSTGTCSSSVDCSYIEYQIQTTATSSNAPFVATSDHWEAYQIDLLPLGASAGFTPSLQNFINMSGGTTGTEPTVAQMKSSTFGPLLATWFNNAGAQLITTSTAGPTDLLTNPITINGTTYTGTGGQNFQYTTGTGGKYFSFAMDGAWPLFHLGYEFYTTLPQTDTSGHWYDQPRIQMNDSLGNVVNPSILANGSAIYVQLECYDSTLGTHYSSGSSSPVTLPHAGTFAIATSTPYYWDVQGTSQGIGTAATVTISIANPAVVSLSNTLVAGESIRFATTGALPTGITAGTTYFVIPAGLSTSQFEFSATPNGTAVATSGTQSGTQSITAGHSLTIYQGGVFQAAISCAGTAGTAPSVDTDIGIPGTETEASGYFVYWRNIQPSAVPILP